MYVEFLRFFVGLEVLSFRWGFILSGIITLMELALMIRIRKDLGSNTDQETRYTAWGFSWFPSILPNNYRINILNEAMIIVLDPFRMDFFIIVVRIYIH